MPVCNKCSSKFPNSIEFEGKRRNLQNRKYCLECSPFLSRNTRKLNEEFGICSCGEVKVKYGKKRGAYCRTCHNKDVIKRQKEKNKNLLTITVCGYNRYPGALEFHHLDPNEKEIPPAKLNNYSFENAKEELDKCVLLCANCHREVHGDFIKLNKLI